MNKYYRVFNYHGGGFRGLRRVIDTFLQIDLFDLRRNVDTRTFKKPEYVSENYMWYAPVYTDVADEMIRQSYDYYTSSIVYSDHSRKSIFVDLGCSAGKTLIQALETNHFDCVAGVEIDAGLAELCEKNLSRIRNDKKNRDSCAAWKRRGGALGNRNFQRSRGYFEKKCLHFIYI